MIEERGDSVELGHVSDREIDTLWHSLRREIRRRGVDAETADDVVQETWLRTLRTPPSSGDPRRLGGWLHVVGARLISELRRSRRNRIAREREAARSEQIELEPYEEGGSRVLRLVDQLPEPYREVVRLRFFEELEIEEIGARLARPATTVRSQLARGLERLRMRLDAGAGTRRRWALGALGLGGRLARLRRTSFARLRALAGAALVVALAGIWLWSARTSSAHEARTLAVAALESAPVPAETARVGRAPVAAEAPSEAPGAALAAPALRTISGRVFAPDGRSVPGAQIWSGPRERAGGPAAVADALGRYRVAGLAPELFLWASDPAWCPSRRCFVASIGAAEEHDLWLTRTRGTLVLLVLEPDGRPAVGLEVELDAELGRGASSAISGSGALEMPAAFDVGGTTDGRGRVSLVKADRARLGLEVRRAGELLVHRVIDATDGDQELELLLPCPPSVAGVALDPEGRPAPHAAILARQLDDRVLIPVVADGAGRFEVAGLIPGPYSVTALVAGNASGVYEGELDDGTHEDLRLETSLRSSIFGRAFEGDSPAAGASVALYRVPKRGWPAEATVRTDAEGRFAFVCGESVDYWLELTLAGADSPSGFLDPVHPGSEVELRARPELAERVPLIVEFVEDVPAHVPTLVKLRSAHPRIVAGAAVDPATRRATLVLPPIEFELDVWVPGVGFWRRPEKLVPDGRVQTVLLPKPGTAALDLELPPGPKRRIDAQLQVGGFNPFGFDALGAFATLREFAMDAEGRHLEAEIFPGRYTYSLHVEGCADQVGDVQVPPGGLAELRIAPVPGVEVELDLEFPRKLEAGEALWFEVRTPRGVQEQRSPREQRRVDAGVEAFVSLPADASELVARTKLGLAARLTLDPALFAAGRPRARFTLRLEPSR